MSADSVCVLGVCLQLSISCGRAGHQGGSRSLMVWPENVLVPVVVSYHCLLSPPSSCALAGGTPALGQGCSSMLGGGTAQQVRV